MKPEVDLKFHSIRHAQSGQRNFDYLVYHNDDEIGRLDAQFKGENHSREWCLPIHSRIISSRLDEDKVHTVRLHLGEAKVVIRDLLLNPRDLTWMTQSDFLKYAADLYRNRKQQPPAERKEASRRVKFIPLAMKSIVGLHPGPDAQNKKSFQITLDGNTWDIMQESPDTDSGDPVWWFNHKLTQYLGLKHTHYPVIGPRCHINLPFLQCKAVIRHVLLHSIDLSQTESPEFAELARFARQQEISRRKLKGKKHVT